MNHSNRTDERFQLPLNCEDTWEVDQNHQSHITKSEAQLQVEVSLPHLLTFLSSGTSWKSKKKKNPFTRHWVLHRSYCRSIADISSHTWRFAFTLSSVIPGLLTNLWETIKFPKFPGLTRHVKECHFMHVSARDLFLTVVSHLSHPSVQVICPYERWARLQIQFPWVGSLPDLLNSCFSHSLALSLSPSSGGPITAKAQPCTHNHFFFFFFLLVPVVISLSWVVSNRLGG